MTDKPAQLEPGRDFYFNEDGLMVLTAHYLKARGYCCKNACTNCPYGFVRGKSSENPNNTASKCLVKN